MRLNRNRILLIILSFITLSAGIAAIFIGWRLSQPRQVTPEQGEADQCTPPAGKIGNDGPGGCCGSFSCQEGGSGDSGGCRDWEVCDVSNGACASGTSCRQASCKGDGSSCNDNSQCCSGYCTNGTCQGGSSCKQNGETCSNNGDCCSNNCTSGSCEAAPQNLACENPQNDGEDCSKAADESGCWARAGSGCWWNNGTCQCGGNPNDGNTCEVTGSGGGTSCTITVSNCGSGQEASLSIAKCSNSYDSLEEYNQATNNGAQCFVGCGSSTQTFGNGTHTIDMTAPSCGRWQLDVVYNGRTICADKGCDDSGCEEPPPPPSDKADCLESCTTDSDCKEGLSCANSLCIDSNLSDGDACFDLSCSNMSAEPSRANEGTDVTLTANWNLNTEYSNYLARIIRSQTPTNDTIGECDGLTSTNGTCSKVWTVDTTATHNFFSNLDFTAYGKDLKCTGDDKIVLQSNQSVQVGYCDNQCGATVSPAGGETLECFSRCTQAGTSCGEGTGLVCKDVGGVLMCLDGNLDDGDQCFDVSCTNMTVNGKTEDKLAIGDTASLSNAWSIGTLGSPTVDNINLKRRLPSGSENLHTCEGNSTTCSYDWTVTDYPVLDGKEKNVFYPTLEFSVGNTNFICDGTQNVYVRGTSTPVGACKNDCRARIYPESIPECEFLTYTKVDPNDSVYPIEVNFTGKANDPDDLLDTYRLVLPDSSETTDTVPDNKVVTVNGITVNADGQAQLYFLDGTTEYTGNSCIVNITADQPTTSWFIDKTSDAGEDCIDEGSTVHYTITVQNKGNDTAYLQTVVDVIDSKVDPANVSNIASSDSNAEGSISGRKITWKEAGKDVGDANYQGLMFNSGESKTFTYTAVLTEPGIHDNTATANPFECPPDSSPGGQNGCPPSDDEQVEVCEEVVPPPGPLPETGTFETSLFITMISVLLLYLSYFGYKKKLGNELLVGGILAGISAKNSVSANTRIVIENLVSSVREKIANKLESKSKKKERFEKEIIRKAEAEAD